jgi:hydrogenase maturation protease
MDKMTVIGFGNILLRDDGAGIYAIRRLLNQPPWPGVQLLDGGVASFEVFDAARTADHLLVIDSLAGGGLPGTLYRLSPEEARQGSSVASLSLHDGTLLQSLELARCLGPFPPVTIYGIEPENISFGMTLTPSVAAAVERLVNLLCAEFNLRQIPTGNP